MTTARAAVAPTHVVAGCGGRENQEETGISVLCLHERTHVFLHFPVKCLYPTEHFRSDFTFFF